ncbi:alpha/beta-hydrolase [Amylocystis lapponica]|nr:alpha/beta-hydrolase [Amylocystis lapponica]
MEVLPKDSRIRTLYPEDLFPNGRLMLVLNSTLTEYSYILPYGRTRFWLLGPEDGTRVVLVHGLATPAVTWTQIAPYLAERGCRVLVYDEYGKGYSEAPKTPLHTNILITQLALLLQYVRWDSAHIAGFSMGGGITAAFATMFPHLVAGKIILMAAAALRDRPATQVILPATEQIDPIPQYREVAKGVFQTLRLLQHELLPGYDTAVASCRLDGPIWGLGWAYGKLSTLRVGSGVPLQVLVIQGTHDHAVAYTEGVAIHERVSGSEFVVIQDGGHDIVTREGHWQQVAESIHGFLGT